MSKPYDYYTQPDSLLRLILTVGSENIPAFVKQGEQISPEDIQNVKAYADQENFKFPVNNPANIVLSAGYYLMNLEDGNVSDHNVYGVIKEAARIVGNGTVEAIQIIEQAFHEKLAEKKGPAIEYEVLDSNGNPVTSIRNKNDIIAFNEVIEENYEALSGFDKFAMLGQLQSLVEKHDLDIELKMRGRPVTDILNINMGAIANFMAKTASVIVKTKPEIASYILKVSKILHENAEALERSGLSVSMLKVAEDLNEATDFGGDLLEMASEPKPENTESFLSIAGDSFSADDINKVPFDVLIKIFGQSFVDNTKASDDTLDPGKLRDAVATMNEENKELLKYLIGKYKSTPDLPKEE